MTGWQFGCGSGLNGGVGKGAMEGVPEGTVEGSMVGRTDVPAKGSVAHKLAAVSTG